MRFQRLSLRNFKCFADADVDLSIGVTVVHGINGSGKSSLLEACFFALYGATAIERTLEEIVTIGAEESEVDLWFTHEGEEYHLYRRIRATGERAATADCTLEGSEETLTGVGDVEAEVRSMLRMDAEAFVNSAFVRQGEINKLIEASPADRKRMIDRLLQLGRLETYRERATEARLGVETFMERRAGRLDSLEEQIEGKDESALYERQSTLETEITELESRIEELETGREEARETRSAGRIDPRGPRGTTGRSRNGHGADRGSSRANRRNRASPRAARRRYCRHPGDDRGAGSHSRIDGRGIRPRNRRPRGNRRGGRNRTGAKSGDHGGDHGPS
ncbi:MAG: AAA family ATPase [Halodesulfurarchaeum sp.]|nr:AAA family ATPase [Halodesulfurarchaeum sp.]